jgi:glycosyltransferase involved in cell wall biosynthesis
VAELKTRDVFVNVLIVGDGEDRPGLESLARELDVADRVRFYGPCFEEPRTAELFTASDVCVAPDAIGLTAMHAMAYGTPVITCDDPARHGPEFEAIIPGKTGELFRPEDAPDLARTIEMWLARATEQPDVEASCISLIERFYHPDVQAAIIERAVDGDPANDFAAAWGQLRRFA